MGEVITGVITGGIFCQKLPQKIQRSRTLSRIFPLKGLETLDCLSKIWSAREDSNFRPLPPQGNKFSIFKVSMNFSEQKNPLKNKRMLILTFMGVN